MYRVPMGCHLYNLKPLRSSTWLTFPYRLSSERSGRARRSSLVQSDQAGVILDDTTTTTDWVRLKNTQIINAHFQTGATYLFLLGLSLLLHGYQCVRACYHARWGLGQPEQQYYLYGVFGLFLCEGARKTRDYSRFAARVLIITI